MQSRWTLLLLVVAAATAGGQTSSTRIGFFAGLNEAQVVGSGVSEISNHAAGAFGAYVVILLPSDWRIQTGALLSMKGWERDEPGTRDFAVAKLTYLEVPVLLRYDIGAKQRIGGVVFAGPGVAFRTGCSLAETQHSTGLTATVSCADADRLSNGTLAFKSVDFGAIIGGGVRVNVGREQLVLTAQYEAGLTDIQNSHDIKNRALTFGIGFEVPISRK